MRKECGNCEFWDRENAVKNYGCSRPRATTVLFMWSDKMRRLMMMINQMKTDIHEPTKYLSANTAEQENGKS